jgi:undecaprenyl-diphosphatase
VVLRTDIICILKRPFQKTTLFIIIATLPAVFAALFFQDAIEKSFASGKLLGLAFLFTALSLSVSELLYKYKKPRAKDDMNAVDALVIGVCQAVAILPAVSRSGLTLSGALSRSLDRETAARFSFLLSIPVILGALVLQLKDYPTAGTEKIAVLHLLVGMACAGVVGFFAVRFMLKIVREKSLWPFAVYTGLLGVFVLVLA